MSRSDELAELLLSIRQNTATDVSLRFTPSVDETHSVICTLEGNTSVTFVRLGSNGIGVESAHTLGRVLEGKGCAIATLDLSESHLDGEGLRIVAEALERNTSVTQLDLRGHGMENVTALAHALERNTSIRALDLTRNSVRIDEAMRHALKVNRSVRVLDLSDNALEDEGAFALARALECNWGITQLSLARNEFTAVGVAAIAEALEKTARITDLDLTGSELAETGARALGKALERCTKLTSLNLNNSTIGSAHELALGLAKSESLMTLDLYGVRLGDDGAVALAEAFKHSASLTSLQMGSSRLTSRDAQALAAALETNRTLVVMQMNFNAFGADGADALCAALAKSSTLTHLNMHGCGLGRLGAGAIQSLLEKSVTLARLRVGGNGFGDEGAEAIGAGLQRNSSLTSLDLSGDTSIGLVGFRALAQALETNRTLALLGLRDCKLEQESRNVLLAAWQKNCCLRSITFAFNEPFKPAEVAARTQERHDRFEEALFSGSLSEAQRLVDEGIDVHMSVRDRSSSTEVFDELLLVLLKAKRLDSFEMLLRTRFAPSLLFQMCYPENRDRSLLVIEVMLEDELWRFPRHEGIMARLEELVGSNASLKGLLGQLNCRHAARALYGMLRKRFKVPWCSSGGEAKSIPRDMARMLAQYVWQSRFVWRQ